MLPRLDLGVGPAGIPGSGPERYLSLSIEVRVRESGYLRSEGPRKWLSKSYR